MKLNTHKFQRLRLLKVSSTTPFCIYNVFRHFEINTLMEYESERAIAEIEMEDARTKAMDEVAEETFKADPLWAQPADTNELHGVQIDQVPEGQWISGGKTGNGAKDEPIASETFDHDLETLVKNGPTELPPVPNTPAGKLTAADTEKLIKSHTGPTDEDLAKMLNCTVLDMYKRMEGGLYSRENLIKAYNGFHSS
jgi:hypothetical protein